MSQTSSPQLSLLPSRKKTEKLSMIQSARLIALIEGEFAASGKNDREFAEHASTKLGFPIAENHVEVRRRELGIPALRDIAAPSDAALASEVAALRRDGAALAAEVERLSKRLELVIGFANLQKHFYEGVAPREGVAR